MGKQEKLATLSDKKGHFFLLAIDQRGSLRQLLAKVLKVDPDQVTSSDFITVKTFIIKILSPHTTGVLTDPQYGYPAVTKAIKKGLGFLLGTEESGPTKLQVGDLTELRTRLSRFGPAQIARTGAAGVKLLVQYNPQSSQATRQFQQKVAESIGQQAVAADLPFILEITSYPQPTKDSVLAAAQEFTQDHYRTDILKLEYPGSLESCQRVSATVTKPWVMLSAGVPFETFYKQMKDGFSGGAAGYLVGRAVWQDAISHYNPKDKKQAKLRRFLEKEGVKRLVKLRELCYSQGN